MRTFGFVAISLFAACGGNGDSKPDAAVIVPDAPPDVLVPDAPPDAQMFDFSCMNNPAPTTAADPLALAGTASDINVQSMMLEPVADATVKGFKAGQAQAIGTTTTDAQGGWSLSLASGGTPLDGFIEATKTAHRTVRLYPPAPLTAGFANAPVLLFADTTFSLIVQFVANTQQLPENGTVGLAIVDCVGTPVSGATISIKENGTEVTTPDNTFDASGFGQPGAFLVFNLPPGAAEVNASVNGMTFRAHTIDILASTTSTTVVQPGFVQ